MARQDVIIGTLNVPVDLSEVGAQMAAIASTGTAMTEQNAQGGVIGWVTPDYGKMHMAWNSARYVAFQMLYAVMGVTIPEGAPKALVPGTGIYFFINTEYTGEVSMTVADAGGRQYTLVADCMATEYQGVTFIEGTGEGGAQFDVAIFARAAYKRITHLTDNTLTWLTISPVSASRLWLINGVVQQGESSQKDWLTDGVRLLTRQTRIQPCSEDEDPEVTLLTVTGGIPSVGRQTVSDETDMADINTLLDENLLTWVPGCKGVALRWLNDQGGVDGYVFTPRSRHQRKAKTSGVVNQYNPDPYQVKDTVNVYDIEAEDLMVLGVEGLPREQYEVLRWLPLSRDIVIYRPEVSVPGNRWQSVTVEDYNVEDSVEQNAVDFEITIRMPKLNLQV